MWGCAAEDLIYDDVIVPILFHSTFQHFPPSIALGRFLLLLLLLQSVPTTTLLCHVLLFIIFSLVFPNHEIKTFVRLCWQFLAKNPESWSLLDCYCCCCFLCNTCERNIYLFLLLTKVTILVFILIFYFYFTCDLMTCYAASIVCYCCCCCCC